jgi:hypothetical protein
MLLPPIIWLWQISWYCWCTQVAAVVPCVRKASGQQEAQRLPAWAVVWARRPLVALSALPPVSVFLERVAQPVRSAQQAATPLVGRQTHAPAALLEPRLSVLATMILLTVSASQGKPFPPCY